MDTVFKLLVAWIVVLFIVNKLLARRKPKSIKILVQLDGKDVEADAKLVDRSKNSSSGLNDEDDFLRKRFLELTPNTRENLESGFYVFNNQDDEKTKL